MIYIKVMVPEYWYDCRIWQYRKNGMCQDIIGDVYLLNGAGKIYLFRN